LSEAIVSSKVDRNFPARVLWNI